MYNGIGLATPRGSGTSGYIQKNLSTKPKPKQNREDFLKTLENLKEESRAPPRKANPEIVLFQRKKEILIHTIKLRKKLEEEGQVLTQRSKSKEQIDQRVEKAEKILMDKLEKGEFDMNAKDSHLLTQAKQREYDKLREAFGMSKDHKHGSAFDFESQQAKRLEKLAKKQKRRFVCPHEECQKSYQLEKELQRHLKYKHDGRKPESKTEKKQKDEVRS